jgi:transcription initiation factor IIE alpha subunit
MKSLEKSVDEFLFNCDKCGSVRETVEFDDVQEKQKNGVRKMMDAMEPILLNNDEIAVFIVFCNNCNEYSITCLGGGGDWI